MNIPWTVDPAPQGSLEFEPPKSKPGDYIIMRAEMDCIIAFSACPQVCIGQYAEQEAFFRMHYSTPCLGYTFSNASAGYSRGKWKLDACRTSSPSTEWAARSRTVTLKSWRANRMGHDCLESSCHETQVMHSRYGHAFGASAHPLLH